MITTFASKLAASYPSVVLRVVELDACGVRGLLAQEPQATGRVDSGDIAGERFRAKEKLEHKGYNNAITVVDGKIVYPFPEIILDAVRKMDQKMHCVIAYIVTSNIITGHCIWCWGDRARHNWVLRDIPNGAGKIETYYCMPLEQWHFGMNSLAHALIWEYQRGEPK